ncbi:MAG: SbcC/MukB-like Walker B domain-containing protein [Puia sp.]|nr:SbcC/MukB-like Walker B domain-containing protein [Puia sp.]
MQLDVFSTDSQKSGFRLQYMEVLNWGTFDQYIYSIKPGGETSLLTGANASGKTTFVDALLTLIVPEKKYRFYNQSSGSEKKGDRTEDSYVMGGYGTINSEATGATKTLYLRESKEEAYSILLAAFANEADQAVSLFQVRYYSNGEMKRMFGIAHKMLRIEDDFKPFDLGGNWKKRLDQQYNKGSRKQVEWFDGPGKYAQRLVEALGMQSMQALHLFNQTVGIKVLGNLDDFIRTHMLEPRNMEEQFQELKKHLATLLDAQRNIEKAEEQIRLLQPIQEHHQKFTALQQELQQAGKRLHISTIWNSYTRNQLLDQALETGKGSLKEASRKIVDNRRAIDEWIEKERVLQNQIEQNKAGQRMKQLEKEITTLQDRKQTADSQLAHFKEWCETLKIEENNFSEEAAYNRAVKETGRISHRLEHEQLLNNEDEFESRNIRINSEKDRTSVEEELNILLQGRNNIPGSLIQLRKDLCAALKIDTGDLPYAGELMQVRTDELHWQPSLEKLLHSFSQHLLVPDKHYKKVTRYVNTTNLRNRLTYYHIGDLALTLHPEEDTVCDKLEFHSDHPLADWVKQQVIQQYGYSCLDDEKILDRYDKAITLTGLIKRGNRHEKDDRQHINDPSRYVMGWNNERKKEALINRRNLLNEAIEKATETLTRCKRKSERLQGQFYALQRIKEHPGFAAIDTHSLLRQLRKAEDQVSALQKEDKEFNALREQLLDIQQQRAAQEAQQEKLFREKTLLENAIEGWEAQQGSLQELLQHITADDKDELLRFQQQEAVELSAVTLDTIDGIYRSFRGKTEENIARLQEGIHREETQLDRCINRVKNPSADMVLRFPDWPGDVQEFSDDAAHAEEYREWLDKLSTENLPRYRKDFENYINVTITYKIGGLNEEMEKWEREIRGHVDKLNKSLGGINFNRLPDTYIQLGARQVADSTIKEFRARLLEALPQAANWQQSSFEEKALHFRQQVQPLISSLDESEAYRSRVMDVRNWFEFWADERYRNTNELKKTYRQMGQLSGGEKAQLTYTILCSAIAYQFGITREGKNSKSLRFIAVDESFSNQDEEKATYLMELCKQLHLQLLVVTPSDKIQVVQDFIAYVHLAQRVDNRHSVLYNMTIKELQEKMKKAELVS